MNTPATVLSADEMLALIRSGRELSAQVTLDKLLKSILEKASAFTDSPDTSVILRHDDRDGLYMAAATGDKAEWVLTTFGRHSAKAIPIDGSKAGSVYSTRNSLVENKVEGHFRGVDDETKMVTESMVCVPLCAGNNTLGVMQILNKRSPPYTEHDLVLLEHFASQAAVAIQNAQLFERLLAHSGLYTRTSAGAELEDLMLELYEPAHTERLTVLFADMRGFTQFCQTLFTPAEVQSRLNEFISMLTEEVIIHDGMVNKFLGDGVMALFRHDNHEERAVKASFRMIDRFGEIKLRWNDEVGQQLDFLDIGMGIVTDNVTLGAIGSEKVRDFTAIGSAVNLAAAFEQDARDGKRIIANHLTYRAVKDLVESDSPEDYELKKPGQHVGIKYKRYTLRRLSETAEQQVFVSHSHYDRQMVEEQLVQPLNALGIKTWYATDDIPKGAFWPAEIRKALSQCTWMLVVVSKNSAGSEWVRLEVDLAVGMGRMKGKIVPVQLDDTPLGEVNEFLITMQAIDARLTRNLAQSIADSIKTKARAEKVEPTN